MTSPTVAGIPEIRGKRDERIMLLAILFSLLVHLGFLFFINKDYLEINIKSEEQKLPEEVTILFPENKPKQIVENINENEQNPDESDLLSDRNSRAANPDVLDETGNQPYSNGMVPFANLTNPNIPLAFPTQPQKRFSREALTGNPEQDRDNDQGQTDRENPLARTESGSEEYSPDQNYQQKKFSADQMGDLTLSTYAWEWAPYINAFKHRLYQVWFAPAAYYRLGLIYGYTVVQFSITRDGHLLEYKVLEQNGHESLEQSSVNAIVAAFPFKPLPKNFPDDKLTITARLIYPNLREETN